MSAGKRLVVQFELSGIKTKQRRWWLLFERGGVDLCMKDPGGEVGLYLYAPVRMLTEIWMGRRTIAEAVRTDVMRMDGARTEMRNFSKWFSLSLFAPYAA